MVGALDGFTIIDVSQGLAAPFAAMRLGDAGANVIKVEPLLGDDGRQTGPSFIDGHSPTFLGVNRNKRSLALDLVSDEGREVFLRLCRSADAVIEDWGPGQADAAQLGYSRVRQLNPELVWCSVTPYGDVGPMAGMPGAEIVVQATSDYMNSLGIIGEHPVRVGTDIANMNTGIAASQAVMAALFARLRGKGGQRVSVSMLGTLLHMRGVMWTCMSDPDEWFGLFNDHYTRAPDRGYKTADGRVYWGLRRGTSDDWSRLLRESGMEAHRDDPRFANDGRDAHSWGRYAPEVKPLWEEAFKERSLGQREVIELVLAIRGDAVPFSTYASLRVDPQVMARELFVEVAHPESGTFTTVTPSWTFSDTPASIRMGPPRVGQHSRQVLTEMGFDGSEVDGLVMHGTIIDQPNGSAAQ